MVVGVEVDLAAAAVIDSSQAVLRIPGQGAVYIAALYCQRVA